MTNHDVRAASAPKGKLLTLAPTKKGGSAAIVDWRREGLFVRTLRGRKMRTVQSLFDETAAALQFPSYFGENWSAFNECLSEMDDMQEFSGIVLSVEDPHEVLADEPEAELATLIRLFEHSAQTYAVEIDLGEVWDRPALPFHVVLRTEDGQLDRWVVAGARFEPLVDDLDSAPSS